MKILKYIGILLGFLVIGYFSGPRPPKPIYTSDLPDIPDQSNELEKYIASLEQKDQPLKEGNEAKIIWYNDSLKSKTPFSIVYLHGFSASHEEGKPIHEWMAKTFGMNLYLARLADHGRKKEDALSEFTAQKAWDDAKMALSIGKKIGDKVILVSTSTGGTLSLMLCAQYADIAAQILMSPNIAIKDPTSVILNDPWGLQIARKVIGGEFKIASDTSAIYGKYWDKKYRIEALVQLEELIETSMNKNTFSAIHQPTLLLYYYKDETHQDPVVRVDAMKKMFSELAIPPDKKREIALPHVGEHVLGGYIKSKDLESVKREIESYLQSVLNLKKVSNN
ncbi:MAG: alpha/beta hydrolase [Saprospiraceae bacterium]